MRAVKDRRVVERQRPFLTSALDFVVHPNDRFILVGRWDDQTLFNQSISVVNVAMNGTVSMGNTFPNAAGGRLAIHSSGSLLFTATNATNYDVGNNLNRFESYRIDQNTGALQLLNSTSLAAYATRWDFSIDQARNRIYFRSTIYDSGNYSVLSRSITPFGINALTGQLTAGQSFARIGPDEAAYDSTSPVVYTTLPTNNTFEASTIYRATIGSTGSLSAPVALVNDSSFLTNLNLVHFP